MTKTYAWTTARGAKISATITSTHITRETVYADGWNVECDCSKYTYSVDELTVNGKPTELKEMWNERGIPCILIDRKGNDRVLAAIPDDIAADIYGEEREENKRKFEAAKKAEEIYNAHCEMMRKAMSY